MPPKYKRTSPPRGAPSKSKKPSGAQWSEPSKIPRGRANPSIYAKGNPGGGLYGSPKGGAKPKAKPRTMRRR